MFVFIIQNDELRSRNSVFGTHVQLEFPYDGQHPEQEQNLHAGAVHDSSAFGLADRRNGCLKYLTFDENMKPTGGFILL